MLGADGHVKAGSRALPLFPLRDFLSRTGLAVLQEATLHTAAAQVFFPLQQGTLVAAHGHGLGKVLVRVSILLTFLGRMREESAVKVP